MSRNRFVIMGVVVFLFAFFIAWATAQVESYSTSLTVSEEDVAVSTVIGDLDFGVGFDITESPTGEANISIDPSELELTPPGLSILYFLTNTASDIGGVYYTAYNLDSGEVASTLVSAGLAVGDDQQIFTYATESGEPGIELLRAGIYEGLFHLGEGSSGGKPVTTYWTLSKYALDTTETLLMTSEESNELTTGHDEYTLHATLSADTALLTTDRLVLKIYANVDGVGTNAVVTIYMEGSNDCHFSIGVTTGILSQIFLRQDGSTPLLANWDVGGFTISNLGLTCTDCIALTSETSGNYVLSVATTAPITGGAAGSEGATLTLALTQDAGTDITADLEEEAHCAEHDGTGVTCNGEALDWTASEISGTQTFGGATTLGTAASDLTLNSTGDIVLSPAGLTQDIRLTDWGSILFFEGMTAASGLNLAFASADGDGTDDARVWLWGLGNSAQPSNREVLQIGYEATGTKFVIDVTKSGTGTGRNLEILYDGTAWITLTNGGGIQVGTPTGGDQGVGTINAVAVYDDGAGPLADYLFDLHFDKQVRLGDEAFANTRLWSIEDTYGYAQENRHLSWLFSRDEAEIRKLGLGEQIARLWEGQEQQQLHIFELERRVMELERQLVAAGIVPEK